MSNEQILQQALEFIEYHSKYWNGTGTHPQEIVEALRAAIAQLESEPVAWRKRDAEGVWHLYYQNTGWKDCSGFEPLYAAKQ